MNYEIRIEGERVDMVPGSGYDLELVNPLFDFERPGGARALGIVLSGSSARNKRILGQVHDPRVRSGKGLYYCEKYISGDLVEKGFVGLKNSSGDFELDFTSNLLEFFGVYQQQLLSVIDFGTVSLAANTALLSSSGANVLCLPKHRNLGFFEANAPAGFVGLVNDLANGASPRVPMFFLKNVLTRIGALTGVSFVGGFWDSGLLASCVVYNTRAVAAGTVEIRKHLPDLTVGGLIMALRKLYNLRLGFDVKNRVLRMDFGKNSWQGACTIDWTSRLPKVLRGTPVLSAGLELGSVVDGGEGFGKDVFFSPAVPVGSDTNLVQVVSEFSGLMRGNDGLLETMQAGITDVQADKRFGARLVYHTTGGQATNVFDGVVLKWNGVDGLAENFWKEENVFRQSSFRVETVAALTDYDIARIGRIFRGESDELPFVHANGVNYVVERVVVPSDAPHRCLVTLWRK